MDGVCDATQRSVARERKSGSGKFKVGGTVCAGEMMEDGAPGIIAIRGQGIRSSRI